MKRIIETDEQSGFEAALGKQVFLVCNYFYVGQLVGVDETHIELEFASIVYETGPWSDIGWQDAQLLPFQKLRVMKQSIESWGELDEKPKI